MTEASDTRISEEIRVCYLAQASFEDGGAHRGGALVIDAAGKPLEFRCTSPIRPNAVQRLLYGSSLEPYMFVELIARPLLGGLQNRYDLVLVNAAEFLSVRPHVKHPTLFVRRQGEDLTSSTGPQTSDDGRLVGPSTGRFQPVVVQCLKTHFVDRDEMTPSLEALGERMDLLEPFERVARALEKVHEEKKLDQQ